MGGLGFLESVPDRSMKPFNTPSHTQAVERIVKEVTEASKHVIGPEQHDGFIRSRKMARQILPEFDTKQQYHPSGKIFVSIG